MEKTVSQEGVTILDQKETDRYIRVVFAESESARRNAMKACRAAGINVDGLIKDVQTFKRWNEYSNVRVLTFSKEKLFIDTPKAASKQAGVSGSVPMHISLQELAKMQASGRV